MNKVKYRYMGIRVYTEAPDCVYKQLGKVVWLALSDIGEVTIFGDGVKVINHPPYTVHDLYCLCEDGFGELFYMPVPQAIAEKQ